MFGYVTIYKKELSEAEFDRYNSLYCGLCRSLGRRYGVTGQMTLTYDMTFLTLLLTALYEPEEVNGTEMCVGKPARRHRYVTSPLTDYAADMNILLAYKKCMDDWNDEHSKLSLTRARLLKSKYIKAMGKYPRQTKAISDGLGALTALETSRCTQLDAPTNCFGDIVGELFVPYENDVWAQTLRRLGQSLGRFIYVMDAYEDLPADRKKKLYNPLLGLSDDADYESRVKDILTLLIGDCAVEFEHLPILQDTHILRNILYSGVWTRYQYVSGKRLGAKERGEKA